MRIPVALTLVSTLAVLSTCAASAGADTTRAEYVAQVEPICRANTDANRQILKGVRSRVKHNQLGTAARQFRRAAGAFAGTIGSLKAVPQPSQDAALLTRWFDYLDREAGYLGGIATALRREQRGRAEAFAVRLQETANLANGAVTGYGFHECLIEPSKFT